jgi:16S rRNA (cytosine967-C5)-methyltransferase
VKHVPRKRRFRRERAGTHVRNARDAAFAVLSEYKNGGRFVAALLEPFFRDSALSAPDERRLAVELTNGVVRREATLDAMIRPHVQRPRHRIEGELWTLVQLGVYQLVFLDAIPAYAAVNETVALARSIGRERWSGFLNGVLRSVERMLTDEFQAAPDAAAVPIAAGRYRRVARTVFSDPSVDSADYFAEAFSFPRWLASRWHERFGFEELCRIGFWFDAPAALSLRVNPLKTNRDELMRMLGEHGIAATVGDLPESIRLVGTARVDTLPGFAEGFFSVQDESAMRAVDRLAPKPGETILDLCAAPGTKTTHLAERMRNVGTIIATDIRSDRLARVTENCARLGISIVRPLLISDRPRPSSDSAVADSAAEVDPASGPFDAILVDVPCSNTGVLGKRPEARWRITPSEFEELSVRQLQLLESASRRLRPGGRLVYSTCSIEPEENEQTVHAFLKREPAFSLVEEWHQIPGRPGDGGYQALLVRGRAASAGGFQSAAAGGEGRI